MHGSFSDSFDLRPKLYNNVVGVEVPPAIFIGREMGIAALSATPSSVVRPMVFKVNRKC